MKKSDKLSCQTSVARLGLAAEGYISHYQHGTRDSSDTAMVHWQFVSWYLHHVDFATAQPLQETKQQVLSLFILIWEVNQNTDYDRFFEPTVTKVNI